MYKTLSLVWLICVASLYTACKPDGQYRELKNAQWKQEETLQFDKEIPDNKVAYKVVLAMRYVAHIPFKELKMTMSMTAPSGKVASKNVVVSLKNAKGMHIGKVMGDIGDIDTVVEEKFSFPEAGKYKIELKQDVAAEIGGIQEIGLKIDPAK